MTANPTGPLSGVTVIDLTRVLAGPYCTMMLAELGARVIKVEAPGRGDDARNVGPFIGGKSAYFMSINRGKESIALNLKEAEGRDTFERLLDGADVLVENYRAGTMAGLGYPWELLHARWPRLIYAAASGFGQAGPYSDRPAYDIVVQALGGIMSLTGHPGDPPTRVGTSIGDIAAGLFTLAGVNAALYARERTGEGTMIDVAMLDCQVAMLENAIARYSATGVVPGPIGSRHPSITPFEAFAASDGYIVVAVGNDPQFAKLCDVLGIPAVAADPRYASNALRTENHDALKEALEAATRAHASAALMALLDEAGIPYGRIQDIAQVLDDPQVAFRNMIITADDPDIGPLRMAGNPIKIGGYADAPTRPPAPALDADRAAILRELEGGRGGEAGR